MKTWSRAQKPLLLELNSAIRVRERYQAELRQVDQAIADHATAGFPGSIPLLQRRVGLRDEFERAAARERALRARLETSAA